MKIGETYTAHESDSGESVCFEVVGILERDYVFSLPNEAYDSLIMKDMKDEILLYGSQSFPKCEDEGMKVFLVKCRTEDAIPKVLQDLKKNSTLGTAEVLSDIWNEDRMFAIGELIMPGLIGGIIVLLTIVHICVSGMLTIHSKERSFGIFYLNGATKQTCFLIQVLVDAMPVVFAFFLAEGFLVMMKKMGSNDYLTLAGFLVSFIICLGMVIISARINLNRLYRKSVIEMIERR